MMNEVALSAAKAIHSQIVTDEGFAGYDGSEFAYLNLLAEVNAVAEYLVEPLNSNVDGVVETWYEVQNEIAEGNLAVDWFLNPETALAELALA